MPVTPVALHICNAEKLKIIKVIDFCKLYLLTLTDRLSQSYEECQIGYDTRVSRGLKLTMTMTFISSLQPVTVKQVNIGQV